MSFYAEVETQTRERKSLEPDSYGTGKQAGLKILAYIGVKDDKSGHQRHSFLVAATRPGRNQLKQQAESNGNHGIEGAEPGFVSEPDYEGTAFLALTLDETWLTPESIALAFSEASRNKEGVIQKDYTASALKSGDATTETLNNCKYHFQQLAKDKVINANTPAEKLEEAFNVQYRKELTQVAIKVGQFFALQDWKNGGDKSKRNPGMEISDLIGTRFSGSIETSNVGKGGSEVASVYSCNIIK